MRLMRTTFFALIALAGLASFAGRALAGPGEGPGGPGGPRGPGEPGARFEQMIEKLNLDPAQKQKVQAILDASKPQREQMRAQIRDAFQEMRGLLDQDNPDQAAVLSQADKMGQLMTSMHKERLKTLLAVRAQLTPDQRAKLRAEMEEHGAGRWRHHGKGMGRGMGGPGMGGPGEPGPEPPPED